MEEKSENINDEMLRGQETPDVSGSNLNNNDGNTLNIEEEHAKDHDIETNGEDFINTSSNKPLIELSEKELFSNWKELEDCGKISVPPFYRRPSNWHALKAYTTLYTQSPIYACVPKLRPHLQLTVEAFVQLFRKVAQPVLFSFENLRSLGFEMHPFTLEELSEIFPFDPVKDKKITYSANGKVNSEYLELGPAVHAFKEDQKLIKTKGGQRSFPRNMKVKPIALSKLGVQLPPLIKGKSSFQSPSLWFGSSSSPTAFHSDCCDNFVYMLTGIKRFTLAPPTDWQALTPNCIGKRKNLCYATPADPSDMSTPTKKKINRMQVDVAPGQILYLPAGTFHHINNLGATLMTNVWTRSSETLGIISCNREKELVSNK